MDIYLDFKHLDAEDLPSNISNQYILKVRSINSGAEYGRIKLIDITDHDKQVRKQVCEEIKIQLLPYFDMSANDYEFCVNILDQIQGENDGDKF